jgi:cytochrome c553
MRKMTFGGLLGVALLAGCAEPALDGAVLAEEKGCVACHGLQGEALAPIYPKLSGQWEKYLRLQLLAYRDGKRENAIMNGMAATLTDDEIRALAKHYGI